MSLSALEVLACFLEVSFAWSEFPSSAFYLPSQRVGESDSRCCPSALLKSASGVSRRRTVFPEEEKQCCTKILRIFERSWLSTPSLKTIAAHQSQRKPDAFPCKTSSKSTSLVIGELELSSNTKNSWTGCVSAKKEAQPNFAIGAMKLDRTCEIEKLSLCISAH